MSTKNFVVLCDGIRKKLELSENPTIPEGKQDAGVLILISNNENEGKHEDFQVLLCVRSRKLRRHPGEVCFPGGMMDDEDGGNVRKTAIREAYEEVGISQNDYTILGNLKSFKARFGVLIHPTVAITRKKLKISINPDEVESVFWISLSRFLENKDHSIFPLDNIYYIHMFQFDDAPTTFGVTALICIVMAIGVAQKIPNFDLLSNLKVSEMKKMDILSIINHVYKFAGKGKIFNNSKI